ncbi:MAG: ABC transporter ATP-binding protein [Bacteroidales bacterium]|nr:MAG: ABC transporter ATP-binding protein [Bacteroidales bacterium]
MELRIKNISKTYSNGVCALDNITITIKKGMFGLLGPNGAGKSTLMRIIATLQEADSGTIFLEDINVLTQKNRVRRILGYLPQEFGLYPNINAEVLLDHLAVLKGISPHRDRRKLVHAILHKTNLYHERKKNLGGFSGGMKQRFGIAQVLLNSPRLIIVDEPTAGLDPAERNRFLNLLSEIGENTIVILSTHIVDDVKELCPDMAIIHEGKLLFRDDPREAVKKYNGMVWQKRIPKEALKDYQDKHNIITRKMIAGMLEIHVLNENEPGGDFLPTTAELEDVYFSTILEYEQALPVN